MDLAISFSPESSSRYSGSPMSFTPKAKQKKPKSKFRKNKFHPYSAGEFDSKGMDPEITRIQRLSQFSIHSLSTLSPSPSPHSISRLSDLSTATTPPLPYSPFDTSEKESSPPKEKNIQQEFPCIKEIPDQGMEYTLTAKQILKMRASQNSVKAETSDGLSLDELRDMFATKGWDKSKKRLRVVLMPGSLDDSPSRLWLNTKIITFDNRRFTAAQECAKTKPDFTLDAILYSSFSPAPEEYKALRKLALKNKFGSNIKASFKEAWKTWDDDLFLKMNNITKGSWGHCIKIRMQMGGETISSVIGRSGFKETPKTREKIRNIGSSLKARTKDIFGPYANANLKYKPY